MLAAAAAGCLAVATMLVAGPAFAAHAPFDIDGDVPDDGTGEPIIDQFGNVKELGPLNSNTTKIGVIHNDTPPTLGETNPNAQVDLRQAWLDTAKDANGDDWLYFAWERDKNTGSGFIAYEFMQDPPPAECDYLESTTAELIAACNPWENRQAGDFMILWDQQGGSLDLWLREWSGTAPNLTLGPALDLNETESHAAYSGDGFRGEATVNLSETIFKDQTDCVTFASTIPSTVTGNSDTADYKDTILQPTTPISNCGTVIIRKETVPDEVDNTTEFGFERTFTDEDDAEPPVLTFELTDDDSETWDGVPFGTGYVVDESVIPSGWALDSIGCSASTGYGDAAATEAAFDVSVSAGTVTFDLESGQVADCTYTNVPQTGSLLIVKERKHAASNDDDPDTVNETHAHAGVEFTVTGGNIPEATPLTDTTDANGEICLDGLVISSLVGDYTVTETLPGGYVNDDLDEVVTVVVGPDCADEEDPVTVNFLNTPLTDITVSVDSQVDGGTFSSIECGYTDDDPDVPFPEVVEGEPVPNGDASLGMTDLEPGVYTCVIVVDP